MSINACFDIGDEVVFSVSLLKTGLVSAIIKKSEHGSIIKG